MVSKETEEQPKVAEVINDDKEEMKKAEAAKKINYDEVLNRADELRKEAGVKTAEEHLHDVKETVENTKKNIKNASEKIIKKFKQETDTNKRHMTNLEAYSIIARGKISDGIDYLKNKFSFSF